MLNKMTEAVVVTETIVQIGNFVDVQIETFMKKLTFKISRGNEHENSNFCEIPPESALAKALLNHKVDETVKVDALPPYKVTIIKIY